LKNEGIAGKVKSVSNTLLKEALIFTSHKCIFIGISILGLVLFTADIHSANADADPRPLQAGLKIEVTEPGVCRLTGADIENAGVDPAGIDPATLRMFRMDAEIAFVVSAKGPGMAASDTVEFYARGIDNQYTGTDVYWLYWGGDSGEPMAWTDGAVSGAAPKVTTFFDRLTAEENHELWTETPDAPSADYWFWEEFSSPQSATYGVDVPSPVNNSANAVLTVYFQGRSGDGANETHHTVISLNNTVISDQAWGGNESFAQSGAIAPTLLTAGSNQITVECRSSGAPDVVYLNRMEVAYQRSLAAGGNALNLRWMMKIQGRWKSPGLAVRISAYGTSPIRRPPGKSQVSALPVKVPVLRRPLHIREAKNPTWPSPRMR